MRSPMTTSESFSLVVDQMWIFSTLTEKTQKKKIILCLTESF